MPYPTEIEDLLKEVYPSQMTLLDHFAGLALSGLCANPAHVNLLSEGCAEQNAVTNAAYQMAISMVLSRYWAHSELEFDAKDRVELVSGRQPA